MIRLREHARDDGPPAPRRARIAIVGTGISGLVVAHHLHRDHDLTLYEAGAWIGGHTHTVDVESAGTRYAVDTGFIVFNELNYPEFCRLLDDLGVASQPSSMSFSVRREGTGTEYNGTSINGLFAQRGNLLRPSFHGMIRDILRFNRTAPLLLEHEADDGITVEEYVAAGGFGDAFTERFLVPLGASIWSCPPRTFRRFPMRFVVEFLAHHRMLQVGARPVWRVVTGGSRTYVEALVAPFRDSIRLCTPVRSVTRSTDGVVVDAGLHGVERFDHVVMACHADQALRVLSDPAPVERELLSAFPYQPNDVVLHTDTSVLPRRRRAWAAWNYRIGVDDHDTVAVTYDMNRLQGLRARETFCVSLNQSGSIDPRRVIDRFVYDHPVYTSQRMSAQRRHDEVIDRDRTSFCGAYWGYGFHEDGVRSGLRVARTIASRLGAAPPVQAPVT